MTLNSPFDDDDDGYDDYYYYDDVQWSSIVLSLQEVSIHVYEKRGTERVGRGRRKEAIAEILKVIEIDYVEEHFINESIILVVT